MLLHFRTVCLVYNEFEIFQNTEFLRLNFFSQSRIYEKKYGFHGCEKKKFIIDLLDERFIYIELKFLNFPDL